MSEWRLYRAAVPAQTVRFNKQKDSKKIGRVRARVPCLGSLLQPESLDAPSRGFFWRRCTWLPHPALVPVGSHLLPAYFVRDGDIERLMHNGARDSRAPLHQRLVWAELSESLRDMSSLSFSTRWAPTRRRTRGRACVFVLTDFCLCWCVSKEEIQTLS